MIEWAVAVEAVKPHVVQISTPRGSGSGFFVSSSATSDLCAVATAAHVIADSHWWEEPIRLFHPSSSESRVLRHSDRAIHIQQDLDTAAILFDRKAFPLPEMPLAFINEGMFFKPGIEIGWLGFPAVWPTEMCFFTGRISAWIQHISAYLVDGVSINGASGGPGFAIIGGRHLLIPNYSRPILC